MGPMATQVPRARVRAESSPSWVEVGPGLHKRPMVEAHETSLVLYRLEANARYDRHRHPLAEMGMLLSGRGRALLGGEVRELRAGDAFYIPPDTDHDFTVDEGPVLMLNVSLPGHDPESASALGSLRALAEEAVRRGSRGPASA